MCDDDALKIRKLVLALGFTWALGLTGLTGAFAGEPSGVVAVPPIEPRVDQLGTMEGVTDPGRAALMATYFLQALACVFVAIALVGHLSLPAKK